jgi:thioesterase domain-containing protein
MGWTNLMVIRRSGKGAPLVCVQCDAGNRLLPRYLQQDRPAFAFKHQGDDGKRIALKTVPAIAAHYLDELREAQPSGPYILCGYSFGGIVAYEMAQQLSAAGERVPLLAIIDSYAPSLHSEAMREGRRLHTLLKDAVMRRIVEDRLAKGLPLSGKLRHFHIIDTYSKAVTAYRPLPYAGHLAVLRSADGWGRVDLGWKPLAAGGYSLHLVPGDHYDLVKEPNVRRLAGYLGECIAAAEDLPPSAVPSRS